MIAKTLVFSNIGDDLGSSLIKIYQDLKPSRIGVNKDMILVEITREADDFELLTQSQPNGLFQTFIEDDMRISIDSCSSIFSSLEEIKHSFYACRSQIQTSPQSLLQQQNLSQDINNGCQIELFGQEQCQKSVRQNCQKDELLIIQCNTIALDIQDYNLDVYNKLQEDLEQSVAIDISESFQQIVTKEKSMQTIVNIEQIKKEDESSLKINNLCNDNWNQKIIKQSQQKILTLLVQAPRNQQQKKINQEQELIKQDIKFRYITLYIIIMYTCLILAILCKII